MSARPIKSLCLAVSRATTTRIWIAPLTLQVGSALSAPTHHGDFSIWNRAAKIWLRISKTSFCPLSKRAWFHYTENSCGAQSQYVGLRGQLAHNINMSKHEERRVITFDAQRAKKGCGTHAAGTRNHDRRRSVGHPLMGSRKDKAPKGASGGARQTV